MRSGYQSKKERQHQIYGKNFDKYVARVGRNVLNWLGEPSPLLKEGKQDATVSEPAEDRP